MLILIKCLKVSRVSSQDMRIVYKFEKLTIVAIGDKENHIQ